MSLSLVIRSFLTRNGIQAKVLVCNQRYSSTHAYKNIIAEIKGNHKNIGFIQLHRPKVNLFILIMFVRQHISDIKFFKALNALNSELMV